MARSGPCRHVARRDALAAVFARELQAGRVPARAVHALDERSLPPDHVLVAPVGDADDDAIEVDALLRQPILEARGLRLVPLTPQHAVLHELREPVGEPVPRDAETALEVLEPARAEEGI